VTSTLAPNCRLAPADGDFERDGEIEPPIGKLKSTPAEDEVLHRAQQSFASHSGSEVLCLGRSSATPEGNNATRPGSILCLTESSLRSTVK